MTVLPKTNPTNNPVGPILLTVLIKQVLPAILLPCVQLIQVIYVHMAEWRGGAYNFFVLQTCIPVEFARPNSLGSQDEIAMRQDGMVHSGCSAPYAVHDTATEMTCGHM